MATIYVYLPEEAVDCWFPVQAEHVTGDVYRITERAREDPIWEFNEADLVRCRVQTLVEGTRHHEGLVAFERAG